MTDRIPVVLCVDVEPDPFLLDRRNPPPWLGYGVIREFLERMREPIERATGSPARYAWHLRMDPAVADVWGSAAHVADIHPDWPGQFERCGDALGLHAHATRWDAGEGVWVHDYGTREFLAEVIATGAAAFREALGRPCRMARMGEFWTSSTSIDLLEAEGVRFDLTLEPGRWHRPTPEPGERYACTFADNRTAPRAPYQPSREDHLLPGRDRTIWMVPLSATRSRPRLRARVGLGPPTPPGIRPLSLWQRWRWPNSFRRGLDDALAAPERPFLAFAIRNPMEPVPGSTDDIEAALRALLRHPLRERFVFCGPEEALQMLGYVQPAPAV